MFSKKRINIKDFMDTLFFTVNDLRVKILHFNFIQVNTYILYDDSKDALLIDVGNLDEKENKILSDFIEKEELNVKYILSTHPHIDHVFGNDFAKKHFAAPLVMHQAGMTVYHHSTDYCAAMPFNIPTFPEADIFVNDGDILCFGKQSLKVLYTPGHCDGSICLLDEKNKLLFVGDVLFEENIGRTDLPTGNYELLLKSIKEKLLVLENDITICPGHGNRSTIGHERQFNPYIKK
jgi:glyoxylase-like metal-dependent hydrolase (beta-lactamase superfamily II)